MTSGKLDFEILAARLGLQHRTPDMRAAAAEDLWGAWVVSAAYEYPAAGKTADDHRIYKLSIDLGIPKQTLLKYITVFRAIERELGIDAKGMAQPPATKPALRVSNSFVDPQTVADRGKIIFK